jgi:2,4-dichlorophenol 6-monooxygenase
VRDKTTGTDTLVRARYLLACDGGRTVGRRLGVTLEGVRDVMRIVSVYMTADLSRWARDPDVLIRWLWVPRRGNFATLVPMGPDHWGPESEEWVFTSTTTPTTTRAIDDAQVVADMKDALGLPHLDAQVHVVSRWSLEGILADRFQVGRVFLVGDAAHAIRRPAARAQQRRTRRPQPLLEARRRSCRTRRPRAARELRGRAPPRRRSERGALARKTA